jgi:putative hemolysin
MRHDGLLIVIILFSLALSFLFSGMEAGVFALSRLRIRQQMRAGRQSAQLLHRYLENSEDFLWTILLGNTLANFLAVSLTLGRLYRWLGRQPWLFLLAFMAIVFLLYAICDLLPKILFRLYPNRLCLALAGPFRLFHVGLSPLVGLVTWFSSNLLRLTGGRIYTGHLFGSRDELRQVMQESAHGLSSEERQMINRVLDLQNLTVRQIMVPLNKVVSVIERTPLSELLEIYRQRRLTRLPVWKEDKGERRIVGLVNLATLFYAGDLNLNKTAGELVRPALYLDDEVRLEQSLRRMQRSGQRLAIVLGRDRLELGIVSLQDILRSIFGEVSL